MPSRQSANGKAANQNEVPEPIPLLEGPDLNGMAVTAGALHGQRETARKIREDPGAHYVLFIKAKRNCT